MITIVDYGMGNLRSVEKAFQRLHVEAIITSSSEDVKKAEKIVLPGVGNFERGMKNLNELGLIEVLNNKVLNDKTPVLGICLGMQLLTKHSEEGNVDGLGWVDANTYRFQLEKEALKVPHIGWNDLEQMNESKLFTNVTSDSSYYFVHSYYVSCNDKSQVVASTNYGISFDSSVQRDNIIGVQFHPEKSHDEGIKLIQNFIELY